MKIQVGFLVSYDYRLLLKSIPQIYDGADEIYLAIDANRTTWRGQPFTINQDFYREIQSLDTKGKIHFFEEEFFVPGLSVMDCEVRERKMLSEHMGRGNWLLQLDADEYFVDFNSFADFLRSRNHLLDDPARTPVAVAPFSVNLFKKVGGGYLVVCDATKQWVATNKPEYVIGRKTRNPVIYHHSIMIHDCLSRSRSELEQKLSNWGHSTDINAKSFLDKWDAVNEHNYMTMRNFFYLDPERWKRLDFVPGESIPDLTGNIVANTNFYPSRLKLILKNIPTHLRLLASRFH